jgi:hypothetical protein
MVRWLRRRPVRLEAIVLPDRRRVSVKPAAIMRYQMAARSPTGSERHRAAGANLGSAISDLDIRLVRVPRHNRVVGAQLSRHGRANALDVRAFKLANGRSISLTDRTVPRNLRESVLRSVCARFPTVLGPGSDWYHEDHIHLDLIERRNNYRICQWNVYDPLPQVAPLLPAERPEEAPPREVAAKSDAPKSETAKPDAATSNSTEPDAEEPGRNRKRRSQQKSAGRADAFDPVIGWDDYCSMALPPPCRAIFELNGESPCFGSSTTTTVPTPTRS